MEDLFAYNAQTKEKYGNVNVKRKGFLEAMQEIEGSPDMEVWTTNYDVCLQILPCAVDFYYYDVLLSLSFPYFLLSCLTGMANQVQMKNISCSLL